MSEQTDDLKGNFTQFKNKISSDGHIKVLGYSAFCLYFFIAQHPKSKPSNFKETQITYSKITELTGMNADTIASAISSLEELKYISVRRVKSNGQGFKTLSYYSILPIPPTGKNKVNRRKGGDTAKANQVRLNLSDKEIAIPVPKQDKQNEQEEVHSKIYQLYLFLHNRTTLDKWTQKQFFNTKGIKSALEEFTLEELLKAYQYAKAKINWGQSVGVSFGKEKDCILSPSTFIKEVKNEKAREVENEKFWKKKNAEAKLEDERWEKERTVNGEINLLRPRATAELLKEGIITQSELESIDLMDLSHRYQTSTWRTIGQKAKEIHAIEQSITQSKTTVHGNTTSLPF